MESKDGKALKKIGSPDDAELTQQSAAREDFLAALARIERFFSRYAIQFLPRSTLSLAKLNDIDFARLFEMRLDLNRWIQSLESAAATGASISNLHNEGLKSFLKLMRIQVPLDFFSTIEKSDIIEIYLFDSTTGQVKQAWRNWIFMSMCSYDLITLMTHDMTELFHRDDAIQNLINEHIQGLFTNPVTQACRIPPHVITEKLEKHNRQFLISNRYLAPVFSEDETIVGFVTTLEAMPLGSAYATLSNVEPMSPSRQS